MKYLLTVLLLATSASVIAQSNFSFTVDNTRVMGDIVGASDVTFDGGGWSGYSGEVDHWFRNGIYVGAGASAVNDREFDVCVGRECDESEIEIDGREVVGAHVNIGYRISNLTAYIRADYADTLFDFSINDEVFRAKESDAELGVGVLYEPNSGWFLFGLGVADLSEAADGYSLTAEVKFRWFQSEGVVVRVSKHFDIEEGSVDGSLIEIQDSSAISLGWVHYF